MARSLTVKHEEKLGTSPLLTAFLVLAFLWLAASALAAASSESPANAAAEVSGFDIR